MSDNNTREEVIVIEQPPKRKRSKNSKKNKNSSRRRNRKDKRRKFKKGGDDKIYRPTVVIGPGDPKLHTAPGLKYPPGNVNTNKTRKSRKDTKLFNPTFESMYALSSAEKAALNSANPSKTIDPDSGKVLPTPTPVFDTLTQYAISLVRPTWLVGADIRALHRVKHISPRVASHNWEVKNKKLRRIQQSKKLPVDWYITYADSVAVEKPVADSTILFTEHNTCPYSIVKYLDNNNRVLMLAHEVPVGRHEFYPHSGQNELVIENDEVYVTYSEKFKRPVKTRIPFWYGRSDAPIYSGEGVFITWPEGKLMWDRTVVAPNFYLYEFYYTKNPNISNIAVTSNQQARHDADALKLVQRCFGSKFTSSAAGYSDGRTLLPYKLLNRIRTYVMGRSLDKEYEINVRKFIARQVRNLELDESKKDFIYEYLENLKIGRASV